MDAKDNYQILDLLKTLKNSETLAGKPKIVIKIECNISLIKADGIEEQRIPQFADFVILEHTSEFSVYVT